MEPQDLEGELFQNPLEHREQEGLGDLFATGDKLPLSEAIDGIDVIHPFYTVTNPLSALPKA